MRAWGRAILLLVSVLSGVGGSKAEPVEGGSTATITGSASLDKAFVGGETSGNKLFVREYIENDVTNKTSLSVTSLQIGSPSNFNNRVVIKKGGTLEVADSLRIDGVANNNRLNLGNEGTLFMKGDFDASLAGFNYSQGAILKVGGEISQLDQVENGLNFKLSGKNATWAFGANELVIGALSSSNSVDVTDGASLEIENLTIGAETTTSNTFMVSTGGRVFARDSITLRGDGNSLMVTNEGILALDFDFDGSSGLRIEKGGIVEAHADLQFTSITNGGGVIMTGADATWTNMSRQLLVVGGETDENFLTIKDGATVHVGAFVVGGESNIDSRVEVVDGGSLIVGSGIFGIYDTNTFSVLDGGKLVLLSDFAGAWDDSNFTWGNGGIIEAYEEGYVPTRTDFGSFEMEGPPKLNDGKILILNGINASLSLEGQDLHIGDLSADNALILTNGSLAQVNSLSVGNYGYPEQWTATNNQLIVDGVNSRFIADDFVAIGGTIDRGNWIGGNRDNRIAVRNGGRLEVGGTLYNGKSSGPCGLYIGPGGTVDAENYIQARNALLYIQTQTNGANQGRLNVAESANFHAGARIGIDAISDLSIDKTNSLEIVSAQTLIIGGVTNATTEDLEQLVVEDGSFINFKLRVDEERNSILADIVRQNITTALQIDPNSLIGRIMGAIEEQAGLGNAAARWQANFINQHSDETNIREFEQFYAYNLPSYRHMQGMLGGLEQVQMRHSVLPTPTKPKPRRRRIISPRGARGPAGPAAEWQGWISTHGTLGSHDQDGSGNAYEDGYDLQRYGTVIGIERMFDVWRVGAGGGLATTMIDGDNGDESDATTAYGMLYGLYAKELLYGDVMFAFGQSGIDSRSGGEFNAEADIDASQLLFHFGGGTLVEHVESEAVLKPYFGLQLARFAQDDYAETANNALGKQVDAFERWSVQSTLGFSMVMPTAGIKVDHEAEFRALWLHEFNNDAETVNYSVADAGTPGSFTMRAPDADVMQLGAGYVADWKNGLELHTNLDGLFSSSSKSATLSISLLYEF